MIQLVQSSCVFLFQLMVALSDITRTTTTMTLQNLSKILDKYEEQLGYSNIQQFEVLKDLPFCWSINGNVNKVNHVQNCGTISFNHAIGLPQKNGQAMPLFDYEQILFDTLQQHMRFCLLESRDMKDGSS